MIGYVERGSRATARKARAAGLLLLAAALAVCASGEAFAVMRPEDIIAGRNDADYRIVFRIREVVPPETPPGDYLGRCRIRGEVVEVLRGAPDLAAGAAAEVEVMCWPNADRQPEPTGPNRYYYADPDAPRMLEMWINRVDGRLVAFDWTDVVR